MASEQNNWQQRWLAALQEQHRVIFDYTNKNLKDQFAQYTKCPVCESDGPDVFLLFEKDMFKYYRCRKCALVYMNPRLNNEATAAFYNSRVNEIYNELKFDAPPDEDNMDNWINADNLKLLEQVRRTTEKGNLLEIGCAKGFFLKEARKVGYKVWGLELNQKNCSYAAGILGNTIMGKDLLEAKFANEMFDVVYMRDVIEHLPNPRGIMVEINRILKKGGIVFMDTHNVDSLIHTIVREKHVVIFGFEHPVHWSPKSMAYLLKTCGFKLNKIYFQSLDFTFQRIMNYFIEPDFTTILPEENSRARTPIVRFLRKFFLLYPFNKLDQKLTPRVSNMLGKGSTMKVFGRKD